MAASDPREELAALRRLAELEARAVVAQGAQAPASAASVDSRPAPTYGALIPNAGNKGIAGVADMVLNAPTNLWNLAKAGYGSAATALGRPDLAPELTQNPDLVRRGMTALGMIRPEAEPVGPAQRMVDTGVQGGVGMLMNPASSVRQAASLGATGFGSGLAAQGTKEATGSDVAAQAVGVLAPLGINAAANQARANVAKVQSAKARNAPRDEALRAGIEAGLQVPPGQAKPGAYRITESIAGKQAIQQAVSTNNTEKINALARRSIGLPDDVPLTPEATQRVRRDAYSTGYTPLEQAGPISTGRLYRQELDGIVSKYEGAAKDFPKAVRSDVRDMVDALRVRTFDAGNGLKMVQTLRDDAGRAFATGDKALGKAKIAAATAIENQIERGAMVPPETMQAFRDARQLMAKTHTVEEAIKAGTGNVDARVFGRELQKGTPLTGEQRVIGAFANNFPKAVQPPSMVGSPGVSNVRQFGHIMQGGVGASLGALLAGPAGAAVGGGIGTGASIAAPSLAQRRLLSQSLQRSLVPKYGASPVDSLLFAPIPQLSAGTVIPPALIAEELRRQGN